MEQAAGSRSVQRRERAWDRLPAARFLSSKVFLLNLLLVYREEYGGKTHFRSSDTPLRMLSRPGWKVMDT